MTDQSPPGTPAGTYLETGAADVLERIRGLEPRKQSAREASGRNLFLSLLGALIIGGVGLLVVTTGPELFGSIDTTQSVSGTSTIPAGTAQEGLAWSYLVPFGSALVGVLLYIMGAARTLRSEWDGGAYFGEYVFRIAQTMVYLLIVWWAWTRFDEGATATTLPPNILGLFVGMYILRVERAVDALGDKFGEALNTVLPSAAQLTGPERRRVQVRAAGQVQDLEAQWKVLRPQIPDLGARDSVDEAVEAARKLSIGRDSERARAAATELTRLFEDVRAGAQGEQWVPMETVLPNA